ncbi:Uncharacterised protein [Prevotella denticola]|uniref:Uncharacterized protein n=1 Tax=Prevotella denticola TaxID=28129 RepID=A0A379E1H2_9BACT|nr:Uncharacterised protein [Prevotella denticola]
MSKGESPFETPKRITNLNVKTNNVRGLWDTQYYI